ncbi:MAG: hypothetical protein SFW67_16985 [Myxococcaceae bacterium]|nr:hypothetical protein [Myxococcaceae bacterium]
MRSKPEGWVEHYRASFFQRALLAFSVFVGLFLSLVAVGAMGVIVVRLLDDGTRIFARATTRDFVSYGVAALFGPFFALMMLRTTVGSFLDLVGFEVVVHGPIDKLEVVTGSRGPSFRMTVQGESIDLPANLYETLREGLVVWATAGRFERSLKVLARPGRP